MQKKRIKSLKIICQLNKLFGCYAVWLATVFISKNRTSQYFTKGKCLLNVTMFVSYVY